jgi:hypothetical protein
MSFPLAFLSLLAELGLGYPDRLVRAIGHPVIWIGRLISFLDRTLNRATDADATRRMMGIAALIVLVLVPAIIALFIERLFGLPALRHHPDRDSGLVAHCAAQPREPCESRSRRAWKPAGLPRAGRPYRRSSDAIPNNSMKQGSAAPR